MSQNKAVYITRQFDNSIYAMRPKGLYREYNIDFTEHTLPIHMLEREMTSGEFSSECYSKKYICGISDVVENDNYLFFNTNIGHCIYDKKKEELTGYGTLYNRKLGVSNNNLMTTGCSNKITMILDPHMLKAQFNIRSKSDKNWAIKDPDNYKWYELIDEESNPVLLIYEF